MPDTCDLCGLPLGRSDITETSLDEMFRFCCPGCRQVFLLLSSAQGSLLAHFKDTDLYRICVETGIVPDGPSTDETGPVRRAVESDVDLPPLDLTMRLEGMWCPACAWLIEEILRRTPGVLEPRVSFFSDTLYVKYLPHVISPVEIGSRIARLGYRASSFSDARSDAVRNDDLLARLGISAILSANVMMVSCALYFGFFRDLSSAVIGYFSYPLLAMTTPVVFYCGSPILRKGASGLRYGKASMDTLISIGVLAAYAYSIAQLAKGGIHLYFDTACMLVTLVLAGKYIETWARRRVSAGIIELSDVAGRKARLESGGREEWVNSETIRQGDRFLVRAKERVPADGRIIQGAGLLDESIVTGESKPRHKGLGEEVVSGSLLKEGDLVLAATRAGSESSLRQMVSLVRQALDRKVPVELLADRITAFFVPAVFFIAGAAALLLYLWKVPAHDILLRSLTILLISCPCALGIATPLVKVAMISVGRSKGLLVRDPGALERARDLDVMLFDKTGTLTEGNFALQKISAEGCSEDEALSRLAGLELGSSHLLAREIVRYARQSGTDIRRAEGVEEFQGRGVKGFVQGEKIVVGNESFMMEQGMALSAASKEAGAAWQRQGLTVLFFGWEQEVEGILVFGDPVRAGVREMIAELRGHGIAAQLVSGDAKETTAAVARSIGIDEYHGEMLPADKARLVASLKRARLAVGMVGDGLNDASALALADVGLACGIGSDLIREASDVAILAADPGRVLDVLGLSNLTAKTIRQNLLFAFLYNATAIPVAASGLLNPLIAVAAMFGSSLTVIGNALRVTRARKRTGLPDPRPQVSETAAEGIA